jgi:hypothetical protein
VTVPDWEASFAPLRWCAHSGGRLVTETEPPDLEHPAEIAALVAGVLHGTQ